MEDEILRLSDVTVHFPVKMPLAQRLFSRKSVVHAVDRVSFSLRSGEIMGLVGESGCGKTTVGKTSVRLIEPTSGRIFFAGHDITHTGGEQLRRLRKKMQIVFQDPHASLNPAMTIGEAILHPLSIHRLELGSLELGRDTFEQWAVKKVLSTMTEVGLTPAKHLYYKYPGDLSGGQKQRAVIARAIITEPKLLIVDEGVSMLDMSVRAKILELMLDLKRRHGLTYLFITHDLATAKFICDRIAIMYLGRIVEIGLARKIYADPKHPYTKALLQAIPIPVKCPMPFIPQLGVDSTLDAQLFSPLVVGKPGILSISWTSTCRTRKERGTTSAFWDLLGHGGRKTLLRGWKQSP